MLAGQDGAGGRENKEGETAKCGGRSACIALIKKGAGAVRQRRPRIAAPDERERLACVALTAKANFMLGGLLT